MNTRKRLAAIGLAAGACVIMSTPAFADYSDQSGGDTQIVFDQPDPTATTTPLNVCVNGVTDVRGAPCGSTGAIPVDTTSSAPTVTEAPPNTYAPVVINPRAIVLPTAYHSAPVNPRAIVLPTKHAAGATFSFSDLRSLFSMPFFRS